MSNDQLYYPNLTPRLSSKLAVSFLHWDRVLRIFPRQGTAKFEKSRGIIKDLEKENILVSRSLESYEIDKACYWLDRMISMVEAPPSEEKIWLETLVRPRPRIFQKSDYYIYEGKAAYSLSNEYPKYFKEGKDVLGNRVYYCSSETGLTYMTLLAYFVCNEMGYKNTITDRGNAFPLFLALNKCFNFSGLENEASFVPVAKAAREVERIFYLPLIKLLKPVDFNENTTIERIINFRKDHDSIRKKYLKIIDAFLSDLYACNDDNEAKDIIQQHEESFNSHLQIMISACKEKGIPVNEKIVTYGNMSNWAIAGKVWDNSCRVMEIIKLNAISLIKPLLKLKPSLDFYNNVLTKTPQYYPLMIQESFAPTHAQRIYQKINQLDKIKIIDGD